MNIIIQTTEIELTDELKNYTEKKFEKLSRYFGNILEIRIELERMLSGHHNKGEVYRAEANIHVPKPAQVLRVEKVENNILKAIDKVVDHAQEILKEYKGRNSHRCG
ncbi:ribosomal subunit interface protein [Candidatus Falkowbacteria bacterium RBG_13_39_14]|uniref:Ribosomal subunit interface protein n=1 Tax=Candidatus Falkowbacteria bacterium RBG_13_39_14 TaxID=1797985 RepID=A0A1F5S0T0_9BACT|nr:MAG: ribosomal subunit interface protein [Candidatus Falkowbacteria bacterium RBG_13_39_14]